MTTDYETETPIATPVVGGLSVPVTGIDNTGIPFSFRVFLKDGEHETHAQDRAFLALNAMGLGAYPREIQVWL